METELQQASDLAADFRKQWIAAGIMPAEPTEPASPSTQDRKEPDTKALVRASRLNAFKSNCPPEFRKPIDRAKIPSLASWDAADAWNGTCPGLWLWSHESGRAKTRMLWRQFGRMHVERGMSILKISGQSLGEEYFRYHMEGEPRAFYRWIMKYDVVMLDDLDKIDFEAGGKRTPRALRELFDGFYENHKPVLVTSNEPIDFFQSRIGLSGARRINEVCKEIKF